jgi:hypothetical protein
VTSIFGRTGAVVAQTNDYSFAQLSGKPTTLGGYGITDAQPLDTDLTAIAALATTAFGRGSLTQIDAPSFRSYIGAGTSSFDGTFTSLSGKPTTLAGYGITDAQPLDADLTTWAGLSPSANFQTMVPHTFAQIRTDLGLVIGTNVQAWDADLDAIAALVGTSGFLKKTAANTWSLDTSTYLTGNQTITLTGDATGSGTTSIAVTVVKELPAGGTTGQVLMKNSGTNYDVKWADVVTPT